MDDSLIKSLMSIAIDAGAVGAALIEVKNIPFRREFRAACEQNTCGKFGRCWMCPPDVGDIDEMIIRANQYSYALVFQSVGQLEDSFDIEGMQSAAANHNALALKLTDKLDDALANPLRLGAGACHICERCAKMEPLPCRFPSKAMASLEAYGIAVSELANLTGLKYINGRNTVTYFGAFLFTR